MRCTVKFLLRNIRDLKKTKITCSIKFIHCSHLYFIMWNFILSVRFITRNNYKDVVFTCMDCRGSGGTSGNVGHALDCQYINCDHTRDSYSTNHKTECRNATGILNTATHTSKLDVHALDFLRKKEMEQVNKIITLKTGRKLQLIS